MLQGGSCLAGSRQAGGSEGRVCGPITQKALSSRAIPRRRREGRARPVGVGGPEPPTADPRAPCPWTTRLSPGLQAPPPPSGLGAGPPVHGLEVKLPSEGSTLINDTLLVRSKSRWHGVPLRVCRAAGPGVRQVDRLNTSDAGGPLCQGRPRGVSSPAPEETGSEATRDAGRERAVHSRGPSGSGHSGTRR